jgi:hypothetical protein
VDLSRVTWRKASYSANGQGECVEVGVWRKASYSANGQGTCVEVMASRDTGAVAYKAGPGMLYLLRDSKDPDGPKLAFTAGEWDAFIKGAKDGEFDTLA